MKDIYLKDFEKLNKYQQEAVVSNDGAVLLRAAVGSGKTTVLVHKVLYLHLIKEIPLNDMVVLTFTNKAAEEIKSRIENFGNSLKESMRYFGTFHSVARTLLQESSSLERFGYTKDFKVIDNSQASEMLDDIIKENSLSIKYSSKLMKRVEEFKKGKHLYGAMKKQDDIESLLTMYKEKKLSKNLMDFDDLIDNCLEVMDYKMEPKWIIIDELQDTDIRQLKLIKAICGTRTKVFAVGDPNQLIYSWRTGNANVFNSFRELFCPKELSLSYNYRSTRTILEASRAFMGEGELDGVKGYGSPIIISRHHDAFNEALHIARRIKELNENDRVPFRSIGVLYRRQAQGEVIFDTLQKESIPCRMVFKSTLIYEDPEQGEEESRVSLMTLHGSKGLEFSHVFITGVNAGNIPLSQKRSEEEEEARLFFVGITRAKSYLELSYLSRPSLPGMASYPSPYISMLPQGLLKREDQEGGASLKELVKLLREEKEKNEKQESKKAVHPKYGEGSIVYEDDSIIRVMFEGYGEKEFSKLFSSLKIL
jgi:superfamily I DNA/RNA helicase